MKRGFERSVTSFSTANQNGFKPMFYELDLVGLVVYVGQQQVKGPFQTAVLTDGKLSIKTFLILFSRLIKWHFKHRYRFFRR